MHRTNLAQKPSPEFLKYLFDQDEGAPEARDSRRVVGGVLRVAVERDRIGNFDRHVPDLHVDAEGVQGRQELTVEVRHRARPQVNGLSVSLAGVDRERMTEKIELHLKH